MGFAAGEVPNQKGVDGAEGELSGLGGGSGAGNVIQEPADFGSGKISIEDETGFFKKKIAAALFDQLLT